MEWYAFKNKRNGKYISGTDFRTNPHRQILISEYRTPLIVNGVMLRTEIIRRGINLKTYKVVKVELKEVGE